MRILRRLPIGDEPRTILVGSELVVIKRYQLVVWVSIRDLAFPSVLDTGHSHNFSISRKQLTEWAGVRPEALREIGRTRLGR